MGLIWMEELDAAITKALHEFIRSIDEMRVSLDDLGARLCLEVLDLLLAGKVLPHGPVRTRPSLRPCTPERLPSSYG